MELLERNPQYLDELRRVSARRAAVSELRTEILASIESRLGEAAKQKVFQYSPLPEDIDLLTGTVTEFFSNVRYLGPLRDDPRPVYGIASSADPRDLGAKGQYTAAVLDLHASNLVDFVPPPGFRAAEGIRYMPNQVFLAEAVKAWMKYFAMADSVNTVEEGKLGHRLLISAGRGLAAA